MIFQNCPKFHSPNGSWLCKTISKYHSWYLCQISLQIMLLGNLNNHDVDGNKNPTNLHIWQWKTVFLHALHVHFLFFFLTLWRRSLSFYDVKRLVLQLCGRREHMIRNVQFCPLMLQAGHNSRTVRTHSLSTIFKHSLSIMTLNNWKMIAETRSYIFRLRSRFRRRRVCLSSLLPTQTKRFAFVLIVRKHWKPFQSQRSISCERETRYF